MTVPIQVISDSGEVKAVDTTGISTVLTPEAPIDGSSYIRKDGDWVVNPAAGIGDAPIDGSSYARKDGAWEVIVGANPSIPQNSQASDYTLVLSDNGKMIFHPGSDTSSRTWTIPANASVAFPVGAVVTFVNQVGAGVINISITTDTLTMVGTGVTGSRSLSVNGIATALKIDSTNWLISGVGLS